MSKSDRYSAGISANTLKEEPVITRFILEIIKFSADQLIYQRKSMWIDHSNVEQIFLKS